MKMKNYIILTIAAASLASCVTPAYKSPKNISVEGLYRGDSITTDTTNIGRLSWKEYYTDSLLQNIITEALDSNINLRVAVKQIEEARAYWRKSRVAFVPNFNAGANATFTDPSNFGATQVPEGVKRPLQNYNFSVSASWEIDIWGKLRSAKRAAYADMLSQTATKDAIVTTLVSDVASAYYQLLMLDAQLKAAVKTVENYTEYLETVKSMKESDQVNEVAVQQAYAQLYGAKAYIPDLKASIAVTENYLCMLMGKPSDEVKRASEFTIDAVKASYNVGVPLQILQYRPDIRAAEFNLRASHYRFNVAKASMYPSLVLSGNVGSEAMNIKNWFDPSSIFWSAVGGLTQPLFNGRALRTQKEVAALQRDETFLMFRQSILNAGMEVSNSLLQSKTAVEVAEIQKMQYDALFKAYDYSKMLLIRDYATYLDVLSAQTPLFSTELNLYATYYNAISQRITLYRALGGGVQ